MKLAAFDIGTNTVLMLAVECDATGSKPRVLADLSRITRLGRGVDKNGRLDPESAQRTLDTIVEFANRGRELGAGRILAVATAALRDAVDGADFIRCAKERAEVDLQIVSGDTEAQLARLAVVNGLSIDPAERLLIVDIGGGSTELIRSAGNDLAMRSLQIGSVRLTERCIHSDPPSQSDLASLEVEIDSALSQLNWNFRTERLVGIAGTVTTVCAVALGLQKYDSARVHGHLLSRAEVERTTRLFASMPLEQRKKLPGLLAERADVICAGAVILCRVMARFGVDGVTVSDQGVRWGLIWREISRGRV